MAEKNGKKQTLFEKLNCPLYPRKLGKKLFLYSLMTWIVSFILFLEIDNETIANAIRDISITSMFSSLAGAILWAGVSSGGYDDQLGSSSIMGIHNSNHPANPLSYHYRSTRRG